MIRLTRFLLLSGALAVIMLTATELRGRLDESSWVLPEDPMAQATELATQHRWAEANLLADFIRANPALGDEQAAKVLAREANAKLDSFWGTARRFARGAATGEPTDMASLLGSLSLDLFVIGDIRDIVVQGWKALRYDDGDTLILALSAVGLTTTLAPELDWAPALLKALKRTGALTSGFLAALKTAARGALKTGSFEAIGKIVNDLGEAARHLGPGPLRGVMPTVKNAQDLSRVASASAVNPAGTYAIARLFGHQGIKRISRGGGNIGTLVASVKVGSRLGKIATKALGSVPNSWLSLLLGAALLLAIVAVRPRPRRARNPIVQATHRQQIRLDSPPRVNTTAR